MHECIVGEEDDEDEVEAEVCCVPYIAVLNVMHTKSHQVYPLSAAAGCCECADTHMSQRSKIHVLLGPSNQNVVQPQISLQINYGLILVVSQSAIPRCPVTQRGTVQHGKAHSGLDSLE